MTTDELIDYYAKLLIMQYANKPKAIATIGAFVQEVIASQIVQQVEDGFNIDTAIGLQLDALGSYRGAARKQVGLNLDKDFFSMPGVSDDTSNFKGFALAADAATVDWYFEIVQDYTSTSDLSDADLRVFIEYLSDLQSLDLTLANIDNFLFKFFGDYVTLTDNEDMTITYHHDTSDPNNLFAIASYDGMLPHPAGVEISVT